MAHIRHSTPDSGLVFRCKSLQHLKLFHLRSEAEGACVRVVHLAPAPPPYPLPPLPRPSALLPRMRTRQRHLLLSRPRSTCHAKSGRGGVSHLKLSLIFEREEVIQRHIPAFQNGERLVIYCQTTGVSAAHATHCATYCTPCRPLIRAFSGWIRTPPPTSKTDDDDHTPAGSL